jgi:hypothetical protein
MKLSTAKTEIWLIAAYKLLVNITFGTFGVIILCFGCNLERIAQCIIKSGLVKPEDGFFVSHFLPHVDVNDTLVACFFGAALILSAVIEIFFTIEMLYRKRWGAIGLSIASSLWILASLFFAKELLTYSGMFGLIIDLLIIAVLIHLVRKSHGYFEK